MANTSFCCQKYMYLSSHLNVCVRERESFCSFVRNLHSQQTNKRTTLNRFFLEKLTVSQLSRYSPHCIAPVSSSKRFKCPPLVPALSKMEASPSYSLEIYFNIIHDPNPSALCTFHLPNIMSSSHSLHRSKGSAPVRDIVIYSVKQ